MNGGINRLKQHITSIGGEVQCRRRTKNSEWRIQSTQATYYWYWWGRKHVCCGNDKERCICNENLELAKKVEKEKAEYELREEVQFSVEREDEDPELSLIDSKKPLMYYIYWIEWWMMVN